MGINHDKVGRAAAACALELRWGAFCNRGALKQALLAAHKECEELRDPCWRPSEVSGIQGCLTGALRVSFGFASSMSDAHALIQFVQNFALKGPWALNLKNARRAHWNVRTGCNGEKNPSPETASRSRKRSWQCADAATKRQCNVWSRRIRVSKPRDSMPLVSELKPLHMTAGDKD